MTGGGWIGRVPLSPEDGGPFKVTHGFEINCDGSAGNLEVNWDSGNHFHMTDIVDVQCRDDKDMTPNPPQADFDTMQGWGMGRYNSQDGYCVEWEFRDAGEPGRNEGMHVEVGTQIVGEGTTRDCEGNEVLNVEGFLSGGNHQAHSN